ncbi:unnamed protein product [[Candida] boidinii]|uniref:Unnamed protein product n=1 Tax=Candida boidinii TaxID=5477 RepID=A0A9W6WB40_CANBO|nr:unnamed protein product [[Candida] boidinii]GMG10459.1 unnamed protein product [[Candida] boidinii]
MGRGKWQWKWKWKWELWGGVAREISVRRHQSEKTSDWLTLRKGRKSHAITLKSTPVWHWSGGTAGTEGRPKSRVAEEDPAQKKSEGIQARNAMGGGKPRPRPDKPRLVKPRPRQDRASTQWPLAGQRSGWIELTRTNKYPDSRMPQHYSYAVMQFEKGGYLDSSTLIES